MMEIPLTRGYIALVDDSDHAELSQHRWCASEVSPGKVYAMRRDENKKTTYMHRVIAKAKKGQTVDHADGDTMNNTRANIRTCTASQNQCNRSGPPIQNTSGYIGVSWHKVKKQWVAKIDCQNKRYHIGYFDDPIEAAKARDKKARELHGEFAALNFKEG